MLHIAVAVATVTAMTVGPTLVQSASGTLQSASGCNRQGAVGIRDNHGLVTAVERFSKDRLQHRSVAHRTCGVFGLYDHVFAYPSEAGWSLINP